MNKKKRDVALAVGITVAYAVSLALPTVLVSGKPSIEGYLAMASGFRSILGLFEEEYDLIIPALGVYANLNIWLALSVLLFRRPALASPRQAKAVRIGSAFLAAAAIAIAPWMLHDANPPWLGYYLWIAAVLLSTAVLWFRTVAKK